uniref:DNA-directed DNA polymerase n=1 Tax=Trichogramma kaykai TaxID=54128 RepID=A0ABD2VYG0_9HYME
MKHDYSEVIEELRRALRSNERIDEAVINEGIKCLENTLLSRLSRSEKHKYQSQLSHLLSIRARYEKRGLGLSDDEVRIKWENVKSAYSCRILTGQITNFTHKDAAAFLQDSSSLFDKQIKETLAKHLFIREIATGFPGRVWVLPQTKERYISFVKFMEDKRLSFRFIDSFKFMASSLDKLASYLKQQPTLRKVFCKDYDDAQIKLLTKKGVFPYEYISSLEKLQETALPPPEQFYSSLTDSDISTKDYEDAKEVWGSFKISNLGEYSDLYLKTDVLLLVEVFENFRKTCHEAYELDPAHYCTLPGYSWDAMLLYTQVELELLTDVDMLLFVEKGIRGGVSQCCSRYSEANNRYMGEDYNPEKEDVYLMYYDINNLYGWAMAQYLPYGGFEWDDAKDYLTLPEDSEYGYILEVDLEYPESLHDSHKDLPLCPEHACPPGSKQRKLLTTLKAKHKYVIHYRSLQQAVRLGVRVTKVHRALKFKQGPWLKSYIDLNTEKRKNGKNTFEKQQYKLCNNAIFGKTMENVRKRIDVKLVSSWNGRYGAEAQISKPNFHSRAIFDENLVAIKLSKTVVTIDKPMNVGFSILDISKTQLYRFHYDFMRDRFKSNCKVLYTDTDSLVYEIRGQNVYEVMKHKDNINEFDTFDYEKDNPFEMPLLQENSKKIGLMKDELSGKILRRFCGLRSKMYSVDIQNGGFIKKIKGIKSSVVKNTITFDDYLQCLRENTIISREQHNIRSRLHVLRSEKERKIALSPHDDKRYLVPGTTDTLPWGHKDIVAEPAAKRSRHN